MRSRELARAEIRRSFGPMGMPARSRSALVTPYSPGRTVIEGEAAERLEETVEHLQVVFAPRSCGLRSRVRPYSLR